MVGSTVPSSPRNYRETSRHSSATPSIRRQPRSSVRLPQPSTASTRVTSTRRGHPSIGDCSSHRASRLLRAPATAEEPIRTAGPGETDLERSTLYPLAVGVSAQSPDHLDSVVYMLPRTQKHSTSPPFPSAELVDGTLPDKGIFLPHANDRASSSFRIQVFCSRRDPDPIYNAVDNVTSYPISV
ncbi:hypothetical protein LX32DRAFT_20249 [Colletotrichum zoysiae]|uniref:Uncharacterized protein n=1 Tax=Colletotrichum zoysiae TaxID=1216348 RepID=A0AAD9M2I1_9PEZI|nr:hypothetical protein LX32DRAFT_20249 [Colletotrichum zoysiae]